MTRRGDDEGEGAGQEQRRNVHLTFAHDHLVFACDHLMFACDHLMFDNGHFTLANEVLQFTLCLRFI